MQLASLSVFLRAKLLRALQQKDTVHRATCMECFLICTNPKCRFVVDLREGSKVLERSEFVFDRCPECNHPWSSCCPFCTRLLEADPQEFPHFCKNCGRALRPEL